MTPRHVLSNQTLVLSQSLSLSLSAKMNYDQRGFQ